MKWQGLGLRPDDFARSLRAFACPDGVTRTVLLQNYHWRAFDWLKHERCYDMAAIVDRCWNAVRDYDDVEYEFAGWMEHSIAFCLDLCRQRDLGFANDDFVSACFSVALR